MGRERILTLCAWGVHFYTALGAVLGLLSIYYTSGHHYRAAFIAMAIATWIDSTDGVLARTLRVRERIPQFDGALLDNVVDYLTYVAAPVFLMVTAAMLPRGPAGLALAGFVMLASAYGFCQADAKTADHYFRGFPSYWNLVAFYLFCLAWSPLVNSAVVGFLAIMVFIPVKYIYPSRTTPLRVVTLSFGAVWAIVTTAMLPMLPRYNPTLLYISLSFIAYYFVVSLILNTRAAIRLARRRRS